MLSPKLTVPLAPSPMLIVMPGVLRSTSTSVVALCSSNTFCGMTTISCGVSRISSRYFGDCALRGTLPATSTNSLTPRTASVTVAAVERRADRQPAQQLPHRLLGREVARDARRLQRAQTGIGQHRLDLRDALEGRQHGLERAGRDVEAHHRRTARRCRRRPDPGRRRRASAGRSGGGREKAAPRTKRRARPPAGGGATVGRGSRVRCFIEQDSVALEWEVPESAPTCQTLV